MNYNKLIQKYFEALWSVLEHTLYTVVSQPHHYLTGVRLYTISQIFEFFWQISSNSENNGHKEFENRIVGEPYSKPLMHFCFDILGEETIALICPKKARDSYILLIFLSASTCSRAYNVYSIQVTVS